MQYDDWNTLGVSALLDIHAVSLANIEHPLIVRVDRRVEKL